MIQLSLNEGIPPRTRTPNTASWLHPDYPNMGQVEAMHLLGLESAPVRPEDPAARKEHPSYYYDIPQLKKLKRDLNATKRLMDPIEQNESRQFREFQRITRPYESLKGKSGILVQQYGAEVVTNAWLKMYELCHMIDPKLAAVEKHRTKNTQNTLRTWHLAEAPGNFILSLNHYLASRHPRMGWDWLANTYRSPLVSGKVDRGYLGDEYGIMSTHADRWLYGSECNGDITSEYNLRHFQANMLAREWPKGKADLVTSDVKYVPDPPNYDEEEVINRAVQTGHLLSSWQTLRNGGVAVLKEFTHLEGCTMPMLYLATLSAERVSICKPLASRGPNSETYLVLEGYKPVPPTHIEYVSDWLRYIRFMNYDEVRGCPSLMKLSDIPEPFVARVIEIETQLVQTQIDSIKEMLDLYLRWKKAGASGMVSDEAAKEWVQTYQPGRLDPKQRLLK